MSEVAACIIARNEADLLGDCLLSIRPWVSEICLLDTGSTDATIAVAQSYGAKVASYEWHDDFAAARNASLAMTSAPWVFIIDADERLTAETGPALLRAIQSRDNLAYFVTREDLRPGGPSNELAIIRLFRNRPDIRFRRPVHEGVTEDLFALGAGFPEDSGVRLSHIGYLPAILKTRDKFGRNLAILRRRFAEAPDDLYSAYKLALTLPLSAKSERLAAFAAAHRLALSLSETARGELPFLPKLYNAHADALASDGALSDAFRMVDIGLTIAPKTPELLYRRGELARRAGDVEAACRLLEQARMEQLHADPRSSLVSADRPYFVITQCGVSLLAIAAEGFGDIDLAQAEAQPDTKVRCGLARLFMTRGNIAKATALFAPLLESDFGDDEVRLLAGEIAWRQRDFETAKAMWQFTDQHSYAGHKARAWLALLAEARREPPNLIPDRPCDAAVAALSALIARIHSSAIRLDPAFLPDALERWTLRWRSEFIHFGRADLADA